MDESLWIIAIVAHLVLIAVLFWKGWVHVIPWFTFMVFFGLVKAPIIYEVSTRASLEVWKLWFYGWDVLTILLYLIAISESWNRSSLDAISVSMIAYLMLKIPAYAFMALGYRQAQVLVFQMLRLPNLGCLFFWIVLLLKYHVQEVKFHSQEP